MKNPFAKQDHTTAIVLGATGVAAAAALAYLYLTENGSGVRNKVSYSIAKSLDSIEKLIKENFKDVAATIASKETPLSKKTAKVVVDHVVE